MTTGEKSLAEIIDERRYTRSSTPAEKRKTCPECGAFTITPASGGFGAQAAAKYLCNDCGNHFDTPAHGGET